MSTNTRFAGVLRLFLIFFGLASLVASAPAPGNGSTNVDVAAATSSYWLANIKKQGTAPGGASGYQVYRSVADFGAKGDGSTDDTAAINSAISSGNRCGNGCDSSTTSPAIIYFPPGTYMVSAPIVQYYFTQFIGDAVTVPTIKALSNFAGIAVIDSDPYLPGGANWYTNQNNFYRQIRNFVIDLTGLPMSTGSGIHWQVAQATSLQNIQFKMVSGGGTSNHQQGIFMDNGSGGWMTDLSFSGGNYGMFVGNQQFTTRNLTFNGCNTAIFQNWDWAWQYHGLNINNCGIGLDMSNSPSNQTVGSVSVIDSHITNTPVGIKTAWAGASNVPTTGNTLIIDNVNFASCPAAVQNSGGSTVLAGNQVVSSWGQGRHYTGPNGSTFQGALTAPSKPAGLLSNGAYFTRSRPQYERLPASSFVSVKSAGAKGDGTTDDTQAIQNAMNSIQSGQVLYFDHGAYVISNTVKVPKNIRMTGEIWPMIMAKGSAFQNQNSPVPMFQVGQPGDTGAVEMSDLVFQTIGAQPGATLVEWNVAATSAGANGMWDCHFRIGGSALTALQSNTCSKNPSVTAGPNAACIGAFMLLHITKSGGTYIENMWAWTADHELDLGDHNQINVFTGRGILIESTSPTWLWGTASEHSTLYNYQLSNAANVFMAGIQGETAYFQTNPDATVPFTAQTAYADPTFSSCASGDNNCKKTWGLRILNSQNVLLYGAGLYSFFENYAQDCVNTNNCQTNMIDIQNPKSVYLYGINTKAAVNMISLNGVSQAVDSGNRNNFCAAVGAYTAS